MQDDRHHVLEGFPSLEIAKMSSSRLSKRWESKRDFIRTFYEGFTSVGECPASLNS